MDVDMSDISLDYDFEVFDWNPETFMAKVVDGNLQTGVGCNVIMNAIDKSSGRYNFTWDKKRTLSERKTIADGCKEKLSVKDPFGVTFKEDALNNAADAIQKQTLDIAEKLFHGKELFRTSNYK